MKREKEPFAKEIPSVFVVWSPFQVLCAVSAIRQLAIKDYLFLIRLPKGDSRNQQIINTLKNFNIQYYTLGRITKFRLYLYLLRAFVPSKSSYNRLFIGDYRDYTEHLVGFGVISNGADIVYLDDGNPSIKLFQGKYEESEDKKANRMLRLISNVRGFELRRNMLTIYEGINNDKFTIRKLFLDNVINSPVQRKTSYSGVIYIVGTCIDPYCSALRIDNDYFVEKLDKLCYNIKESFSCKDIYYFPHGRETSNYDELICKKYDIHYHKCKCMVELEILSMNEYPSLVYGFTTNALFTIKKLFPNSRVINILFESKHNSPVMEEYIEISKYYQQNDIDCLKIPLSK